MELTTTRLIGFLALFVPIAAMAQGPAIARPESAGSLAFARYVASIQERDPFTESGPVLVEIDASLPGLYKQSRVLAIRQTGDSERSGYLVLQLAGDAIVMQEVVVRYLKLEEHVENLPFSSVAITPENYRFRHLGQVGNDGAPVHVFRIVPKKKRDGLIQGQLWIDSVTGAEVLQSGHLVKTPSDFAGRVEIVRDTKLLNGQPCIRMTHVAIETRRAGRGELTITEIPLAGNGEGSENPRLDPQTKLMSLQR
jgi:hypothetical protein